MLNSDLFEYYFVVFILGNIETIINILWQSLNAKSQQRKLSIVPFRNSFFIAQGLGMMRACLARGHLLSIVPIRDDRI